MHSMNRCAATEPGMEVSGKIESLQARDGSIVSTIVLPACPEAL